MCCERENDFAEYLEFTKALAAFLVLRRAASGTTDGIDTHFREIMNDLGIRTDINPFKPLPNISQVKAYLRQRLDNSKLSFTLTDKIKWVEHVAEMPIYSTGVNILRFLLLASHHHTNLDTAEHGLLTRAGVTPSNARNFLNWNAWDGGLYETLEHIAPQSEQISGWAGIYDKPTSNIP